jgi:hypothetical protein
MKTIKIASVCVMAMLLTTRLWAQNDEKKLTVPLSSPGKPYKLEVGLVEGSITVTGYEGKDVIIEAQGEEGRKGNHDDDHGPGGMHRIGANGSSDISAEESNNEVNIHGSLGRRTNLVLKVPQNEGTFKIHTVNNGNIVISNINGELEVSNVNGSIKITNVSGSVVANTVNGPVVVSFKSIDPKAAMAFSTLNGNVDVTFPAGVKANVKLKSDRGDIYTDFDVVTDQHKPTVTHSDNKGMYSLKIEDWVYGKIDGGGPEVMMKTTFGSIYIRKAK